MLPTLAGVTLLVSAAGILSVFMLYPCLLWLRSLFARRPGEPAFEGAPPVSVVVVARNAEGLIGRKIQNCLSLDYPPDGLELVLCSDGSTDGTNGIMRAAAEQDERVQFLCTEGHEGKIPGLNRAVGVCAGEIVLLTDADAMLEEGALKKMVRHYADPEVGGVCGQRVLAKEDSEMGAPQKKYIKLDSAIKLLETRLGWLTSNDGKLYSVRRELFQPVKPGVTDDLYTCLNVVAQGYKFLFEPDARVFIGRPSRNLMHEIKRRRRIVAQSLNGIFARREMLNPFRYGLFACGLFVNKVMRRMLPVFLLLALCSSVYLGFGNLWLRALALAQVGFYTSAAVAILLEALPVWCHIPRPVRAAGQFCSYFCAGNVGTLAGLVTFLAGREIQKWEPVKQDV